MDLTCRKSSMKYTHLSSNKNHTISWEILLKEFISGHNEHALPYRSDLFLKFKHKRNTDLWQDCDSRSFVQSYTPDRINFINTDIQFFVIPPHFIVSVSLDNCVFLWNCNLYPIAQPVYALTVVDIKWWWQQYKWMLLCSKELNERLKEEDKRKNTRKESCKFEMMMAWNKVQWNIENFTVVKR